MKTSIGMIEKTVKADDKVHLVGFGALIPAFKAEKAFKNLIKLLN